MTSARRVSSWFRGGSPRCRARHRGWPAAPERAGGGGPAVLSADAAPGPVQQSRTTDQIWTPRRRHATLRPRIGAIKFWKSHAEPQTSRTDAAAPDSARTRCAPCRPSQSRSVIAATEATSGRRRPLADGVLHAYGLGCLRDPQSRGGRPEGSPSRKRSHASLRAASVGDESGVPPVAGSARVIGGGGRAVVLSVRARAEGARCRQPAVVAAGLPALRSGCRGRCEGAWW